MKLFYFSAAPNFGDALNPWLWPQLLGPHLDDDASHLFLGIGSILKNDLPPANRYSVLGAGGGYGPFPTLDERWRIYAVRGPLSAQALGLPAERAATDAAALLRTVSLPSPRPGLPIGFMPHFWAMPRIPWPALCRRLGLRYIDPRAPMLEVLSDIRGCQCLISEAMHGAIVADTCRVPWVPVVTGGHVLDFKWRDWMTSLELEVPLRQIGHLDKAALPPAGEHPVRTVARRSRNALVYAFRLAALTAHLARLRRGLLRRSIQPHLSRETVLQERTDRLCRGLDRLREDLASAR